MRDLARTVVNDHDRRSLSGAVGPIEEPDLVVSQIVADVAGFGPLQPLLDDPYDRNPRREVAALKTAATGLVALVDDSTALLGLIPDDGAIGFV